MPDIKIGQVWENVGGLRICILAMSSEGMLFVSGFSDMVMPEISRDSLLKNYKLVTEYV